MVTIRLTDYDSSLTPNIKDAMLEFMFIYTNLMATPKDDYILCT